MLYHYFQHPPPHALISFTDHGSLITVFRNVFEQCQIHGTFASGWPVCIVHGDVWQEICMMHMQALTNLNTTQARFGRSGNLKGGSQGLSKHASNTQTEYAGSWAGSGMGRRRDSWTRSLKTARGAPLCHSARPGTLPQHRESWRASAVGTPLAHHDLWALTFYE